MNFSADDKHLTKFVSCLCFQGYFDVKIRQILRVETRVSFHVRVRGPSRQGILLRALLENEDGVLRSDNVAECFGVLSFTSPVQRCKCIVFSARLRM